MNILLLGHAADAHVAHLRNALQQASAVVHGLDTRLFPTSVKLSWQPHDRQGSLVLNDQYPLALQDIHRVFWRTFAPPGIPPLEEAAQREIAFNDAISLLRTLMQASPALWVNSWEAYQFHKEKPLQLSLVEQLGVPIPATLVSNDPAQVMAFARSLKKAIFKPVYGGAHAQFVTEEHLELERLRLALRLAPVTIQDYIPGTNLRSYVIGDAVYTAEIRTSVLDFRQDVQAEIIPIDVPEGIRQQCRAIARSLKLRWTAIDWRLRPTGEYVFLEANPSPMFIYFEQRTGFPITQQLVKLLTGAEG
jgi:glutathione synthase/RimK-type ligase-like ATP-grasp enzyme